MKRVVGVRGFTHRLFSFEFYDTFSSSKFMLTKVDNGRGYSENLNSQITQNAYLFFHVL